MRTRRIAIRCRRTGRSATVVIGTTGTGLPADLPVPDLPPELAVPPVPDLDLPPVYGAPAAEQSLRPPAHGHVTPGHVTPGRPTRDHAPPGRPVRPSDRSGSGPAAFSVPAYLADSGPAPDPNRRPGRASGGHSDRHLVRHDGRFARVSVNPWRTNRGPDLTLADILARPGRRDLDWDRNPGWPAGVGWAYIARGGSPRHARRGGWRVPGRALVGTGLGLFATALIMLIAELLH